MNSVPIDGFRNLDAREAPHSHDKDLLAKWIGWSVLAPKVEKILTKAQRSGKILAMGGVSSTSGSLPPARGPVILCGCGR